MISLISRSLANRRLLKFVPDHNVSIKASWLLLLASKERRDVMFPNRRKESDFFSTLGYCHTAGRVPYEMCS